MFTAAAKENQRPAHGAGIKQFQKRIDAHKYHQHHHARHQDDNNPPQQSAAQRPVMSPAAQGDGDDRQIQRRKGKVAKQNVQ